MGGLSATTAAAVVFLFVLSTAAADSNNDVTYDGRALIVNGTRRMLFSGSIHYTRSTPQMWPSLIEKAKNGGLDVIQTYAFWNVHEPVQGQYNFKGNYDIVAFIKEIWRQGLYVSLRLGPFIESEWKYGGFPLWLHDVPGIVFRSDNEPFKFHMQKFVSMIVNMMKSEGLYASQGGPIIVSQIENEYQMVEPAFHEKGPPYVRWAASMAVALQTGVPWMMCKQDDAPDPVINTCNGLRCGETFVGPNSPNKPAMWTELWTSQYQTYGGEPYIRSAEELAYHVALFIAVKKGSFVNYYMYHGGTNFGDYASSYVTTSYYDLAPLDEYGLTRQPTWGHLKELHGAIKQISDPLLFGTYSNLSYGPEQQGHVYETKSKQCVAFLVNSGKGDASVKFRNGQYELPRNSISILDGCKNVIFNTAKVIAQHGVRSANVVQNFGNAEDWGAFVEGVSDWSNASFKDNKLLEHIGTAKDASDYLWYTTSYEFTSGDAQRTLHVYSRAHILHAFVNGVLVGSVQGPVGSKGGNNLDAQITLNKGQNSISLLSAMVGLPDSGAYLEGRVAGLRSVRIQEANKQTEDISGYPWGYQIGLSGENLSIFTQEGSDKVSWTSLESSTNKSLMWYKMTFNAPSGTDPVALDLTSMGKGEAWVNGQSIGRYWVSLKTAEGKPSQSLYHVPRSFLNPSDNLLVIFEEVGGDPLNITLNTISITGVCASVSESHHPSLFSSKKWPSVQLKCGKGRTISSIKFASYGTPNGGCENYATGSCHSSVSKAVTEKACLGKKRCAIPLLASEFGGDPCPGTSKSLTVVANCS